MADGLPASLAEAFAAAETELGLGDLSVSETDLPSVEEEVDGGVEQAEVRTPVEQTADEAQPETDEAIAEILDLIEESQDEDTAPNEQAIPDSFEIQTVDGVVEVSLEELKSGYMRQADYTRKTQQLADSRRAVDEATRFHEAFTNDPLGFAKSLAVEAGLVDPSAEPVKRLDVTKIPSPEDFETEVQKRLDEAIKADPRVQQAQVASARAAANQAFTAIEQKHGVTLNDKARVALAQEAVRRGVGDLEMVYDSLWAQAQLRKSQSTEARKAAPSRPSTAPTVDTATSEPKVPQSIAEAMELALLELNA